MGNTASSGEGAASTGATASSQSGGSGSNSGISNGVSAASKSSNSNDVKEAKTLSSNNLKLPENAKNIKSTNNSNDSDATNETNAARDSRTSLPPGSSASDVFVTPSETPARVSLAEGATNVADATATNDTHDDTHASQPNGDIHIEGSHDLQPAQLPRAIPGDAPAHNSPVVGSPLTAFDAYSLPSSAGWLGRLLRHQRPKSTARVPGDPSATSTAVVHGPSPPNDDTGGSRIASTSAVSWWSAENKSPNTNTTDKNNVHSSITITPTRNSIGNPADVARSNSAASASSGSSAAASSSAAAVTSTTSGITTQLENMRLSNNVSPLPHTKLQSNQQRQPFTQSTSSSLESHRLPPHPPSSSMPQPYVQPEGEQSYKNSARIVHSYGPSGMAPLAPLSKIDAPKDQQQKLIPIMIGWPHGGRTVFITGTFNNWRQKVRLNKSSEEFTTVVDMAPGTHRFKFIVDDEWRCSDDLPIASDHDGNLVNYLEVVDEEGAQQGDGLDELARIGETLARPASPSEGYTTDIPSYLERNRSRMGPLSASAGNVSIPVGSRSDENLSDALPFDPPHMLPPHLQRVLLNSKPINDDPYLLPVPSHVTLNHLYACSIRDGVMAIGCTTRYRKKYVTTVYYKPVFS